MDRLPLIMTLSVEADSDDGGFVACVEEVPGAAGQGATEAEAQCNLFLALAEMYGK